MDRANYEIKRALRRLQVQLEHLLMRQDIRPLRFSLAWMVAAVMLLPLSLMIWIAAGLLFAAPIIGLILPGIFFFGTLFDFLAPIFIHVVPGSFAAAMGWCIGALQLLITRRYLQLELRRWREFSTVGGFLAGVIASFVCLEYCVFEDINLLWVRPSLRPVDGLLLSLLLFMGILSTVQFLTLRRQASAAALWVIAHLVSVPLVYALWKNPLAAHFPYTESYLGVILTLPVVAALVTAPIMLWIVSHSAAGYKAKRKAVASGNAADEPRETRAD